MANIIELNVGGKIFTATRETLNSSATLSELIGRKDVKSQTPVNHSTNKGCLDDKGRIFIDRDPERFALVLQYLRDLKYTGEDNISWMSNLTAIEQKFLMSEATFYRIEPLVKSITALQTHKLPNAYSSLAPLKIELARCHSDTEVRRNSVSPGTCGPSFLSLGYRANYTVTRDSLSDKFRRITRITVSGRANVAKEVFMDDINDSRDPDRQPSDGYTSRYYLKHNILEKAFETLLQNGFHMVTSCSSGAKTLHAESGMGAKQWTCFIEYVFCRNG